MPTKARITPEEIDLNRLKGAVVRRFKEIPAIFSWKFSKIAHVNREKLARLENQHWGERCVLIANGPSLSKMDFSLIKNEFTIGMNRIYLLFDKFPFNLNLYICVNELVLEQFSDEIAELKMMKLLNWNRHQLFDIKNPDMGFVKLGMGLEDRFGTDLKEPIFSGGTVTFVALQAAYFLGFKEVVLIGLDHNFVEKGTPNAVVKRTASEDQNHFHPNYFPQGSKWQLPDLHRSEVAYEIAKNTFEKAGRRIIDATEGGKCQVFEKKPYSEVFGS